MSDSPSARAHSDGETTGSEQREARTLSGAAQDFDIQDEVDSLKREASWQRGDRNSRTLVHEPQLRVLIIAMKAGSRLQEHRTEGAITIQTINGHVRLSAAGRIIDLPEGRLATVSPGVAHDLEALDESAFLLTVAWPN